MPRGKSLKSNKNNPLQLLLEEKKELLFNLPPLQKLMKQDWEACGVNNFKVFSILSSILDDWQNNPNASIAVAKIFLQTTCPPNVQKIITENKNLNINQDISAYNKELWNYEPDIKLPAIDGEEN